MGSAKDQELFFIGDGNPDTPRGTGFCYWGAERIAFKGAEGTDGSAWENQALSWVAYFKTP